MTTPACELEARTAAAARTGEWLDELRAHVTGCPACREAQTVAAFMCRAAGSLGRQDPLPEPTLIWLRAGLARRLESEKRAFRARLWRSALPAAAVGLAGWLAAWLALREMQPLIAQYGAALTTTGIALAVTLGIVYLTALRPLRHASAKSR